MLIYLKKSVHIHEFFKVLSKLNVDSIITGICFIYVYRAFRIFRLCILVRFQKKL